MTTLALHYRKELGLPIPNEIPKTAAPFAKRPLDARYLYAIDRVRLFAILTTFPAIQLHSAGEVFADGWMTKDTAAQVLTYFPNALGELAGHSYE